MSCITVRLLISSLKYLFLFYYFSEDRIRNGVKKLIKARTTTQQGRLDSFFSISHTVTATIPNTKKAVRIENENFACSLSKHFF
jgi:flap endonuclease-1